MGVAGTGSRAGERTRARRGRVLLALLLVLLAASWIGRRTILVAMGLGADTRTQLLLSLGSWAVFLALFAVTAPWRRRARERGERQTRRA